ncbi:hypothetical protein V5O48_014255 [Marasmius crinis-equi]|uniref:Uncharacterized protein n=1 Tax=Marasmius crinis-equi TaxID=585013 RepID=A0ABR3EXW4_9AGAR
MSKGNELLYLQISASAKELHIDNSIACIALSSTPLPVEAHEGQVGAVFSDAFVTTPNTDVVFDPLRGFRSIHLRKGDHFGLEDPLYFPQPFTLASPHLAMIPLPNTDPGNANFICWYRPTAKDFDWVNPEDQSGSSTGLGLFSGNLRARLRDVVSRTADRVSMMRSSHKALSSDQFIRNYLTSLQWLQAQLNCACSYSRSSRTFALVQRICLELIGRITWITDFAYRWEASDVIVSTENLQRPACVIGALVGNLELVQRLWGLGIPVWLVRELKEKHPHLRVLKWVDSPNPVESLSLRTGGFCLSLEDTEPPSPAVWTGRISVKNLDRYEAMARELRKAAMAHLYEEDDPVETSPSSGAFSAMANGPPRKRQRLETQIPPPPPTTRVKFKEVESPIMPPFLPSWRKASELVGQTFNPNEHKNPLGYFLPDPQMIAVCGLESGRFETRTAYLQVWLKLRHVLCYRLRTPAVKPLGPSRWRTVLGIEKMGFKEKRAAKQKAEVEEILVETLRSGNLECTVNITRLSTANVLWKGKPVDVTNAPNTVLQEILWELFEIGFRYEVLLMDRKYYGGKLPRDEREPELLVSLLRQRSIIPFDLKEGREGFAAAELLPRRVAIWLFLEAMADWTGAGKLPDSLQRDSAVCKRIDPHQTAAITPGELDDIEYAIAHHYISRFANTLMENPAPSFLGVDVLSLDSQKAPSKTIGIRISSGGRDDMVKIEKWEAFLEKN